MATEIERKFLVRGDGWQQAPSRVLRQGYVCRSKERAVRVRTDGEHAYLTIKGATLGWSRLEFEYEIPLSDAEEMLDKLCERPLIEKRRYDVLVAGKHWEVDEFLGDNLGLVVAEIELQDEREVVQQPDWIGPEVTSDPRYLNANLVAAPYSQWSGESR